MAQGSIRALVALDRGVDRSTFDNAIPPNADIHVVGVVDDFAETWTVLQETSPDLLVVVCDDQSEQALFVIDRATSDQPDRPVVVLTSGSPNGFVRRIFEAGADDIISLPESPERIEFALLKAVARKKGTAGGGGPLGSLICVLGPKGGTGKTLTTCNVSVALAAAGKRVVVVDLDLQFGDVGLALGLRPERTIADLAKAGGSLDAEKVDAYLTEHSSGVKVLMAPTRPDQAALVTAPFLKSLYMMLRGSSDYVIVDTPPGFTSEVIASIDSSSAVFMVAMMDSLSLKNTKLGLETLSLMGYDRENVTVVLNRADSRVGIDREDVTAILGRAPDVLVPSDREITRSVNEAVPIVVAKDRSEAAKAFRDLARYAEGAQRSEETPVPDEKPRGRRLLARRGA